MLKRLIAIYGTSLLFTLVCTFLVAVAHYLDPAPFTLLYEILIIFIGFIAYRIHAFIRVSRFVTHPPEALRSLYGTPEKEVDLPRTPSDIPHYFNLLFASVEDIYRQQIQLLNDYAALNQELDLQITVKDFLIEANRKIYEVDNPLHFFEFILEQAVNIVPGATHGCVMKLVDETHTEYIASVGYNLRHLQQVRLRLEETFLYVGTDGRMDRPVIISDIKQFNEDHVEITKYEALNDIHAYHVNTTLTCPIYTGDKLYGMLNIDSDNPDAFNNDLIEIAHYLSTQLGDAINHYLLFKQTEIRSNYDTLTGIMSRSHFMELFPLIVRKALRYNETLSLALLDINDLKVINDTHGHDVGDYLLKRFSTFVSQQIREEDLFVRYGGDEFILVFFGMSFDRALQKLDAIRDHYLEQDIRYEEIPLQTDFSYGAATFPDDTIAYELLIKTADQRMYAQKQQNKTDARP